MSRVGKDMELTCAAEGSLSQYKHLIGILSVTAKI